MSTEQKHTKVGALLLYIENKKVSLSIRIQKAIWKTINTYTVEPNKFIINM